MIFGISHYNFFSLIILSIAIFVGLKIYLYTRPSKNAKISAKVKENLVSIQSLEDEVDNPDVEGLRAVLINTMELLVIVDRSRISNIDSLIKSSAGLLPSWISTYDGYTKDSIKQLTEKLEKANCNCEALIEALLWGDRKEALEFINQITDERLSSPLFELLTRLKGKPRL